MDLHSLPVHSVASHGQTRTAWTAQEDAILRARVAAIGAGAGLWPEVAKGLPGRTSKSCAERWQTHLNPAYVRSSEQEFSDWEIAVMILAYARHGSNWLKVSEYLPMRSPQNIKNQVNYFNAKPEHVRDNRYLAARIDIEDLLATEPEVVKQRRERLREVLLKGQSALPAGALQAAYAAAKLTPPNLGNSNGSRLHPYARPTSLQASYGMQAASSYQAAPMQPQQQHSGMQPQQQDMSQPSPPSMSAMNAMMLLAQAACGDDEVQEHDAAAAAAAAPVPEGMLKMEQEEMQQASQHGVAGLQLPMIHTRPQHSLLQENGSGGSSSSYKQPGSNAAQMWSYPSGMSMMMNPNLMMMQGAQDSPMASSQGHPLPASAAAALAAAHKAGTASPASTPLAALDGLAATAGLSASEFAAMAAATAGAMPRPSKSGSSQGTRRRRTSKAASKYGDFISHGDDMSTSEEGEGEETGDLTPLAQRVAEAAAAAVSAATQQAVTATQQACQVLSMAQMLAQQAQQQEAKPAASDRSSQPSGAENGSEQQMIDAAVTQRLNNQHSTGERAAGLAAAAVAAAAAGTAAAHRLDDAVRHLLEAHYEKMQQLQQQLQQELQEQLATLGKLHTVA